MTKKLLLKISDLFKIIIPTLHTPMGLIDKFLESFLAWVHKGVVSFTEEEEEIREAYVLAEENLTIVEDLLQEAKENNDGSDKGKAWVRSAQDKMNAAQSARAKGNDIYQKMLKKHSKDPESFHNKLETICQDLNIV
jgi:hypothetical protein